MDEEMMDANSGGHGLSGPDEGSAYRSDSSSAAAYAHHPATQGYNEYSQGQVEAQQERRQQRRRASQQRAASMGHANLDYTQPSQSGHSSVRGAGGGGGNPQRGRSGSPPPIERRGSMSEMEQQERRQQIKAILADRSIPEVERRKSIQALMDGRRSSIGSQASYGSSYGGAVSHASSHHSSHAGGSGAGFAVHSAGSGGAPTALQAHIAAGGVHPHQAGPASVHSGQHSVASGGGHHPGMSPVGPHGFHPDDRTVHSASAVLMGYKPKSHPYNSSTTPVPAVAAQDQSFFHQQNATEHSKRAELSRPACEHYNRNCTIVSPCCGAAFGCRVCHDDCPVLPPVIQQEVEEPMGMSSGLGIMDHEGPGGGAGGGRYPRSTSMPVSLASFGEPQHHTIDRHAIREVICRRCYTRQSSKTNNCISCGVQFGEYHCAICNLWMSAEERPYHCAECGFCRVGGAENFRHCNDCGMCIDASLFAQHNCKVGKYMQNCPICQEDLFSSRSASHEMPCGHAIHWHCFRELAAHDSRCPVCKKTAETHERMQPTWNAMAMGIELQPVPPDLAKAVTIICNDCERTDENRAWHFLGVQCRACTSFNTVVERITMVGPDAHAFLATADPHPSQRQAAREAAAAQQQQEQRQQRHRQHLQPPTQQQSSAMVTDGEVPAEEQERLFREQQEYQARYMQMRRAEQQQLEQMRSEHEQQQQQQRGGGSRRRIRDAFSGRRRSMGL